jgi:peptidoglycan/xylan/chitin deacetylase (PgdA/CDA1 family)
VQRRFHHRAGPILLLVSILGVGLTARRQNPPVPSSSFPWPQQKRAALSLTFDDARESQLTTGVPLFAEFGIKATFYLTANNIGERAPQWREAGRAGHELANHSSVHPCSGHFPWSHDHALEDYTLERMRAELTDANEAIHKATGVRPQTFAYPCGQSFVGRGSRVASYVPLVSELFLAGRGWLGETSNDPAFVDLAQVLGFPMDDVEYAALKPALDEALKDGRWIVLAGHDISTTPGPQVTRVSMLRGLLADLRRADSPFWTDTVANVAQYVKAQQTAKGPR